MSTLSSASTTEEVQAAYDDNASYFEDGSLEKARIFVTACRILLRRIPKSSARGGSALTLTIDLVQQELDKAQQFLADAGGLPLAPVAGSQIRHADFRGFRN